MRNPISWKRCSNKTVTANGTLSFSIKPDRSLRFDFSPNLSGRNASLKIGPISNSYGNQSFDVSGNRLEFMPNQENPSPGRYYARITNSSATEFSEIQSEAQ